jgi:epoxyqueuosine reductase QueG
MNRDYLLRIAADFSESSPTNYLQPEALDEETRKKLPDGFDTGLRFFLPPILSIGSAFDPGFEVLKKPEVVGSHHMMPADWLPEARTVISLFLPYTERIINSNTLDAREPSWEWLFGRVDAQAHLLMTAELIRDALIEAGYKAHLPYTDKRLLMRVGAFQDVPIPVYSSNWSERHVAYITGLGTFGRMTNFITNKGTCGRLISVVTDWDIEPDKKDYTGLYDYCSACYACYRACPGQAFSNSGKDISKCSGYIRDICGKYTPRYGCGKCQSGLPCSTQRLFSPKTKS